MKKSAIAIGFILASSLVYAESDNGEADKKAAFSKAYKAFKQAYSAKDYSSAQQYAKQSYELGCEVYGAESLNCAKLAHNYAERIRGDEAVAVLRNAIPAYETKYGSLSFEVADLYLAIVKNSFKGFGDSLDKIEEIAEALKENAPIKSALLKHKAGVTVVTYTPKKHSSLLLEGYEELKALLPEDDIRLVESRVNIANYYQSRGNSDDAIELLEENVAIFNQSPNLSIENSHRSRYLLIQLYWKYGEEDKAILHIKELGKIKSLTDQDFGTPLVRVNPKYPLDLARIGKSGWVKMKFTVDEKGFVVDPEVIASKGGKGFETNALAALRKWRYLPKFVDGKAVESTQTVQLDFNMEK